MRRRRVLGLLLAVAGTGVRGQEMVVDQGTAQGLAAWLVAFRPRALAAGISEATLARALAGVQFLPGVVERDRRQDEFTKTIWDYLDKAVSDARIAAGQKALHAHADVLARIEARYGVDAAIVVAIWGLESDYGAVRGDIPVLSALATLSYDARRGEFFEGELIAALQIVQAGDVSPEGMLGSWAGATGHTQFMPSSFLAQAVDWDGSGKPDIWSDDPADALASTAAYLAAAGWVKGLPWGQEVVLPMGFDYGLTGGRTQRPIAAWAALGVTGAKGEAWAALLVPAGARGPAFLVTDNFAAIEAYNKADAYVIAVGHLADRIKGGAAFRHGWPRDLRVLTLAERVEMQQHLLDAGVYAGEADGKIGPLTIGAVKEFQRKLGLVPDGYPSLEVLMRLR